MTFPSWVDSTDDREALEGRPDHGGVEWDLEDRRLARERAQALRAASVEHMTPFASRAYRIDGDIRRRTSRWPEPPARKARRFTTFELCLLISAIAITVGWAAFLALGAWLVFG